MLEHVVAVIGPPAVGKTTLTMRLAELPNCEIFRLREHVPDAILAATATSADRIGWIDDLTVTRALRAYFEQVLSERTARTVLLDNFPGTGTQVRLLTGVLDRLAPRCVVHAVELLASREVREQRVLGRRVCHECERDPIHDPRIPAQASRDDPDRCAYCGGVLHPRRGDAPRLFTLRTQRYEDEAVGIRAAFEEIGIQVVQFDSDRTVDTLANEIGGLLTRC
jgi:adenylate kinase family enzyme